ncbi:uncharacterized protein LOC119658096 [Hermetia illucens]|uniref:uncharacterized protein LOC119658096 n=1 Tax=Hermetia illucens TaxID=343691 RepID=UPI0018CC176D|nr:uncharacterized protein LOC119658096 [Hermetia illucens]
MRIILGLLILVAPLHTEGFCEDLFGKPTYKTSLSEAVVNVIQKFFTANQADIQILSRKSGDDFSLLYLVNEILFRIRGAISYMHWHEHLPKRIMPSTYNMLVVDDYRSFQRIYERLSKRSVNFDGYFLIIISENLEGNMEATLNRIFLDCYNRYITNVNILIRRADPDSEIIDMYTYFPFTETQCQDTQPVLHDSFVDGKFSLNVTIFPNKVRNIHRCPFTIVTWHNPPHMFIKNEPGRYILDGIDGNILGIIQRKLNFSLRFDFSAANRGNILQNGTATGALALILNGHGNITICAHGYVFTRPSRISASTNYFSASVVFAIPARKCYSSFEKLFFVFKHAVWYLTLGTYVAAIILVAVARFFSKKVVNFIIGDRNDSPYLNMFTISTGVPVYRLPKRNFARYLLMVWTLSWLVLRSAYQGALFHYLQKSEPRPQVLTLMSLLNNGFTLFVPEDCLPWFSDFPEIRRRVALMNMSLWEYFEKMQDPEYKGVVLTTDIQIDYYNHRNRNKTQIKSLEERMFSSPQNIFYPKYSYLVTTIDLIIQDCLSGGYAVADITSPPYNSRFIRLASKAGKKEK